MLCRCLAWGNVRDLVRQHAGQLVFVARGFDEAGVYADVAAGKRKRVDRRILDDEEAETVSVFVGLGRHAAADVVDVLVDERIVDHPAVGTDARHELAAELGFLGTRQHGVGRAAHVGQADRLIRDRGIAG